MAIATWVCLSGTARAAFPGHDGQVAYTVYDPGHVPDPENPPDPNDGLGLEISLADADGSNVRRVTDNTVPDFAPAFSPDGKLIAFASDRYSGDKEVPVGRHIYLMNADGSHQRLLPTIPPETSGEIPPPVLESNPAFSRDGKWVYFTRYNQEDGYWGLFSVRLGARPIRQRALLPKQDVHRVVALPDGRIAWISRDRRGCQYLTLEQSDCHTNVWVGDPEGGDARQITDVGETDLIYELDVTPNGKYLLLSDFRSGNSPVVSLAARIPVDRTGDPITDLTPYLTTKPGDEAYAQGLISLYGAASPSNKRALFLAMHLENRVPASLRTMPIGGGDLPEWSTLVEDPLIFPQNRYRLPWLWLDWQPRPRSTPKPNPPRCRGSWTRTRFFVFRNRPVIRMVARYKARNPGRVKVRFFKRSHNDRPGREVGRMSAQFTNTTRWVRKFRFIRVRKRVSRGLVKQLRHVEGGFIAKVRVRNAAGYCKRAVRMRVNLFQHRRVDDQHVWFREGTFAPGEQPPR